MHIYSVAHLAGELVTTIKRNQPDLGITDDDVLCVMIAGLCHDLGKCAGLGSVYVGSSCWLINGGSSCWL